MSRVLAFPALSPPPTTPAIAPPAAPPAAVPAVPLAESLTASLAGPGTAPATPPAPVAAKTPSGNFARVPAVLSSAVWPDAAPPEPVGVVRLVLAAQERQDLPTLLALLAPDVAIRHAPRLPWGGARDGHAGAVAFLQAHAAAVRASFVAERVLPADDRVVVVGRTQGVALATGRAFDVAAVHVCTVRAGQVALFETYLDTPAMLAVLR